jgi:alpha-galactosidase
MNLTHRAITVLLLILGFCSTRTRAQSHDQSPPLGWNSWNSYGLTITEAPFHDSVSVLKTRLLPFGWRYAVIDEG